jgi:hypothetical protein
MKKRDGFILQQMRRMLDNERYALIAVIALIFVPYTSWVGMTILSLVTLRKGAKQGGLLVIPAMTAHTLVALTSTVWTVACIDALIQVVPCFLASCMLRLTNSWRAVASFFFCLLMVAAISIHLTMPKLIETQWMYLEATLHNLDSGAALLQTWQTQNIPVTVAANYLFGLQGVCLIFALLTPIWCARSLQAQLFYPGGFRQEMLNFRGDKYGLVVLFVLAFAAYSQHTLAMNALPMVMMYFMLAGLSVGAFVLSRMKPLKMMLLLVLPMMLVPMVVIPMYILLGGLDSLINCRLFLAARAGKTM